MRSVGVKLAKLKERGSGEGKGGEKEQTMNETVLFPLSPCHHLNFSYFFY